jgi:murein DD-endopeptidase MepM/ murein hydrolase activator NlpD
MSYQMALVLTHHSGYGHTAQSARAVAIGERSVLLPLVPPFSRIFFSQQWGKAVSRTRARALRTSRIGALFNCYGLSSVQRVVIGLTTVGVACLFAYGAASPAPASAQTGTWWWGNPDVTQGFGCTANNRENLEPWRNCSSSTPFFHDGIDLGWNGQCGIPIMAPVAGIVVESVGTAGAGFGQFAPILRLPSGDRIVLGHTRERQQ